MFFVALLALVGVLVVLGFLSAAWRDFLRKRNPPAPRADPTGFRAKLRELYLETIAAHDRGESVVLEVSRAASSSALSFSVHVRPTSPTEPSE